MILQKPLKVSEIAGIIKGETLGKGDIVINRINRIEDAQSDELSFCSSKSFLGFLKNSHAGCIIVSRNYNLELGIENLPEGLNYIIVDNAYAGLLTLLNYFNSMKEKKRPFRHPSLTMGEGTDVHNSVYIGPNCVLGKNCKIDEDCILHANVVVYDNVTIGRNTEIYSNVVIAEGTVIGEDCIIHPGAVIGSDGFGYTENTDGSYVKIPQMGNVTLGNKVDIGANTTIDRAVIGSTIIEDGVKLDNLIHIAHNVRVGANTAMAAQTGVSGSTKVGKRNRFGGQVGLSGHIETPDDVTILAQSGVAKSIPAPGLYFGSPVKERMRAFKIEAVINQLPDIVKEIHELKKKLAGK